MKLIHLINNSNQTWEISHGAGMFTYEIYDDKGKIVQQEFDMRYRNDVGYSAKLQSKEVYNNNGEENRSKEYYEFQINSPGTYYIKTKAEFRMKNKEKYVGFEIVSKEPSQITVE